MREKLDSFFFFFFQAEDGIRDGHVTGVQTCVFRSRPFVGGEGDARGADHGRAGRQGPATAGTGGQLLSSGGRGRRGEGEEREGKGLARSGRGVSHVGISLSG